jgi:uncharacterized protein YbaR (Trm112 family)
MADQAHESGCDPRVRPHVVCPVCQRALDDREGGLACTSCQVLYPVVDGVPWLLPERSRALSPED